MNSFAGDALFGSNIAFAVCSCVRLLEGDGSEAGVGISIFVFGNTIGLISTANGCFRSIFRYIYAAFLFLRIGK